MRTGSAFLLGLGCGRPGVKRLIDDMFIRV